MTGPERGWLLLCADLGDGRKPMTLPQIRVLRARMQAEPPPADPDRQLNAGDLRRLGYDWETADRIAALLDREAALDAYLALAAEAGVRPMTRISPDYPVRLEQRLGSEAPAVLFCKGDPACLAAGPAAAVVGSRVLTQAGAEFARRAGERLANAGWTLISGNARGADQTAQEACLAAGGAVISVLPDSLADHDPAGERVLFVSEQGWHLPIAPYRALDRNRLIHALGEKTLAAQSRLTGGTWSGSLENLRRGWSPLFVNEAGGPGCARLIALGANPVRLETLDSLRALTPAQLPLTEMKNEE